MISKILVVEDCPVQALALQRLLKRRGLQVLHARNGQFGVTMARRWMPDAIVLDVNMPDMDGFEVCRRLQGNTETSHIPIIVLTANDSPSMFRHSISLGAIDFIPKDGFANAVLLGTLCQLHILAEIDSFPKSGGIGE